MTKPFIKIVPGIAIGLAAALAGTAAAAQPATAPGDMRNSAPMRPANQAMARPGQFVLNGDGDVELVRFSSPRDMLVCLPPRMNVKGRPALQGTENYPITISWDNQIGEIQPGNCLAFDAAKVKVSPSSAMPAGAHVVGQIFML